MHAIGFSFILLCFLWLHLCFAIENFLVSCILCAPFFTNTLIFVCLYEKRRKSNDRNYSNRNWFVNTLDSSRFLYVLTTTICVLSLMLFVVVGGRICFWSVRVGGGGGFVARQILLPSNLILHPTPRTNKARNQFTGTIPSEIGLLTGLGLLDFGTFHIVCPRLFSCLLFFSCYCLLLLFGLLCGAKFIYRFFVFCRLVDENQLTGSIPSEIGMLTALFQLKFGRFFQCFVSFVLPVFVC